MKKVYTITYHSSYNHGSNLQAYALQKFVTSLSSNIDYKIINLRNYMQKEVYKLPFEKKGFVNFCKKFLYAPYKKDLYERENNYENFQKNYLNLTKEYSCACDFDDCLDGDYYISGSDQLWNYDALDFDWSYYLNFIKGVKKISYAASFGATKKDFDEKSYNRIKKYLNDYNCISVRDEYSKNLVREFTGVDASVNFDPTMLLKKEDWLSLISDVSYKPDFKYILLYDLKGTKDAYEIAKKLSKLLGIKVIVVKESAKFIWKYNFVKKFSSGPKEFLNLINNAELVISSSFHGTIFSILLQKPFFAVNGSKDMRIRTLLKKVGLEDRSISIDNILEKYKIIYDIDYSSVEEKIEVEREKSKEYLMDALDLNK